MIAHCWTRAPAGSRRADASLFEGPLARTGAAFLLFLLAGCGSVPPIIPLAGNDPADPGAPARPASYRSVVQSSSGRPAEASDWQQQNERVAPQVKP